MYFLMISGFSLLSPVAYTGYRCYRNVILILCREKNGEGVLSVIANSTSASGTGFTSSLVTQGNQPDSELASQASYHLLSASEKQVYIK